MGSTATPSEIGCPFSAILFRSGFTERSRPDWMLALRDAAIAQLVEHIIRNDGVGGSNPSCGTNIFNGLKQNHLAFRVLKVRLRYEKAVP
jgi:hypothetical protein